MVNRVMAAKANKLRKQIRKLPRNARAEYIPVAREPAQTFMSEASQRAASGLSFVFRRGTTSFKEAEFKAARLQFEAMFPELFGKKVNEPRKEAKERVAEILASAPLERHVRIAPEPGTQPVMVYERVHLFFTEGCTRFWFVKHDLVNNVLQHSVNFCSKNEALAFYRRRKVCWKSKVQLESSEPLVPPESSS